MSDDKQGKSARKKEKKAVAYLSRKKPTNVGNGHPAGYVLIRCGLEECGTHLHSDPSLPHGLVKESDLD